MILQSSSFFELTFSSGLVTGIVISVLLYILKQSISPFLNHFLEQRRRAQSTIDEWCNDALTTLGELERQHILVDMLSSNGRELRETFLPLSKELVMLSNSAPEEIDPTVNEWLLNVASGHDILINRVADEKPLEAQIHREEADIPIEWIIEQLMVRTLLAQEQVRRFRGGENDMAPPPDVMNTLKSKKNTETEWGEEKK